MDSSTIASPFVVSMVQGARRQGYDLNRILSGCGISPAILDQPRARITFQQISRLSLTLTELMDDEAYGLLDRPQRRNTYRFMCYSAIHASHIGEALGIFADFNNMLDNSLHCSLEHAQGSSRLNLIRQAGARILNNYAIEQIMLTMHRTLCWMANQRIRILQVDLDYPAPEHQAEFRYLFYGAPVVFRQPACALHLEAAGLALKNRQNSSSLHRFLQQIPLTLISRATMEPALSARIRSWLETEILDGQGASGLPQAAQFFAMHPQTLRRKLQQEHSSYQHIKMEIRRDLAVHMLSQHALSVEQVSGQLGFSEPSAFIRAFKGWTGLTPLSFRKMSGEH